MHHAGWRLLVKLFLAAKDDQEMSALFDLFLTPAEKESLVGRCRLIKELISEEKPQRQIAEDLQLSIAKITRGSNQLKRSTSKLRMFLKENL